MARPLAASANSARGNPSWMQEMEKPFQKNACQSDLAHFSRAWWQRISRILRESTEQVSEPLAAVLEGLWRIAKWREGRKTLSKSPSFVYPTPKLLIVVCLYIKHQNLTILFSRFRNQSDIHTRMPALSVSTKGQSITSVPWSGWPWLAPSLSDLRN